EYFILDLEVFSKILAVVFGLAGLVVYLLRNMLTRVSRILYFVHLALTVSGLTIWLLTSALRVEYGDSGYVQNVPDHYNAFALIALLAQLLFAANTLVLIFINLLMGKRRP